MIPRWSSTAAYLLANQIVHGGDAWLSCSRCETRVPLNLAEIILKRNPLWSPWNRSPKCPTCGGRQLISGAWSKDAFVIPLINASVQEAEELHGQWKRYERWLAGSRNE